ncbi:hypothetical protein Ga0102493_11653 [Erythrobacter litoralis]|nr:hypothetical protein Ga0102493_11653 [Erythrobacter litoralis]
MSSSRKIGSAIIPECVHLHPHRKDGGGIVLEIASRTVDERRDDLVRKGFGRVLLAGLAGAEHLCGQVAVIGREWQRGTQAFTEDVERLDREEIAPDGLRTAGGTRPHVRAGCGDRIFRYMVFQPYPIFVDVPLAEVLRTRDIGMLDVQPTQEPLHSQLFAGGMVAADRLLRRQRRVQPVPAQFLADCEPARVVRADVVPVDPADRFGTAGMVIRLRQIPDHRLEPTSEVGTTQEDGRFAVGRPLASLIVSPDMAGMRVHCSISGGRCISRPLAIVSASATVRLSNWGRMAWVISRHAAP